MRKTCFLDRDGTLIADRQYLSDPDGVDLLPGVCDGLEQLVSAGFFLAVLTNQSGIGRGYFFEQDMVRVNQRVDELLRAQKLRIDAWYFCPHHPVDACACRKPQRGLADQAATDFDLDLTQSFVIGDSDADIGLARNIGAVGIRVLTGRDGLPCELEADFTARTFDVACRYVTDVYDRS